VQFHPESIKTKLGIKILKNFIRIWNRWINLLKKLIIKKT
jgi:GMP synthase-like glutamine amidotransferase